MASPQVKKGYTRIANEILEQIARTVLSGTKYRIVIIVWRYTYGFQRKEFKMSTKFIADAIGSDRSYVYSELMELEQQKILILSKAGPRQPPEISFNKNYDEWTSSIPIKSKKVKKKGAAPPSSPVKKKKVETKKIHYDKDNTYYKMADYFHSKVKLVAKDAGIEHLIAKANLQSWADDMRKLIEIDKVGKYLARDVMDWVVKDDFWSRQVLSASTLRKQFPKLVLQMKPKEIKRQPKQKDPRDKEVAFQKWMTEGKNPDEFNWNG